MSFAPAQAAMLPDGRRLHLHHGPIDMIVEVWGADPAACYAQAAKRFETLLEELVAELPKLRRPAAEGDAFDGPTARRICYEIRPYSENFVTYMAGIAGAGADEILAAAIAGQRVEKAYVNNGGDVAFHLAPGEEVEALGAAGPIVIGFADRPRGLATSGWGGRSWSLGIADAVTVAARNATAADIAATLVANHVDLPGHPAVTRRPAEALSPDSDLGARLVTTDVGPLAPADRATALARGVAYAEGLVARGLIDQAALTLQGETRHVGAGALISR